MDTIWVAVLGAVAGGLFTMLGAWIQGRASQQASLAAAAESARWLYRLRRDELRIHAASQLAVVVEEAWSSCFSDDLFDANKLERAKALYGPLLSQEIQDAVGVILDRISEDREMVNDAAVALEALHAFMHRTIEPDAIGFHLPATRRVRA